MSMVRDRVRRAKRGQGADLGQQAPHAALEGPEAVASRIGWRQSGVRMTVYGFATLMDLVLSAVLFVLALRARDLNYGGIVAGSLIADWSAVYFLSSLLAGRVAGPRNAAWLLVAACVGVAGISLGYVRWPSLGGMYVMTALLGVATAFFFTPFQIFMKQVDEGQNKGVARSSGLYVFAWSTGFALGPFVAGMLWQHGWDVCHFVNGVAASLIVYGVLALRHHAHVAPPAPAQSAARPATIDPASPSPLPDLVWMAWIFSGLGCGIASMIRSQFPNAASTYGISEPAQGTVLLLMSGTQALVGFLLGWSRRWMYESWPVFAFGLAGVAGLSLLAVGRSVPSCALAAVSFGVYTGSIYFYIAYHALIHPARRARYVSINEAVVGVVGVLGPALGGLAADGLTLWAPYAGAATVLLIAVTVHALLHAGHGSGRSNANRL